MRRLERNRPYTVCIKKRLVFEIQISHNYSDLIVLNCVELMIRDKNVCYLQKRSINFILIAGCLFHTNKLKLFEDKFKRLVLQHDHRFSEGKEWFLYAYDARLL
jgi:hypothetical protein